MTRCRVIAAASLLLAAGGAAIAHEFKLESLINAFVKIEAREAHLVVRVPLHLVGNIKFPTAGPQIDLTRSAPALQQALQALGSNVLLWEDGSLLVPGSASARLSLPSDRSFESYDEAVAHVARPPAPDTA